MKYRIAMMYCYFGKWPSYANLFFKTCSRNPNITFKIFTDCQPPDSCNYSNVEFIPFTLEQFNVLATKRLGMEIRVANPYKLCDFKPAYGYIFEEVIKDYDYWGFGDIDIILGNVEHFITDELLEKYDIISARKEFITGFFSVFKNSDKVKELFFKSRDYQMVFQSEKDYCFDECNYAFAHLFKGGSILDIKTEIQSMTEIATLEQNANALNVRFETIVDEVYANFTWENGKLLNLDTNEEVMLLHLINHKANLFFKIPAWKSVPDTFFINNYSFYKNKSGLKHLVQDAGVKVNLLSKIVGQSLKLFFVPYAASKRKLDKASLSLYAGDYQYGDVNVKLDLVEDALFFSGIGKTVKVQKVEKDLFITEDQQFMIKFNLNKKGNTLVLIPTIKMQSYSFNKLSSAS